MIVYVVTPSVKTDDFMLNIQNFIQLCLQSWYCLSLWQGPDKLSVFSLCLSLAVVVWFGGYYAFKQPWKKDVDNEGGDEEDLDSLIVKLPESESNAGELVKNTDQVPLAIEELSGFTNVAI